MGDEDADAAESCQCVGDDFPGRGIDVVGGPVHDQELRFGPKCAGNLHALLLAAGEGVEAPAPVLLYAEGVAEHEGFLVVGADEVLQILGRCRGILLAVSRAQRGGEGAAVLFQLAAEYFGEGALAAAVVAYDACPAAGESGGKAAKSGFGRFGVGVVQGGNVQLHGFSVFGIGP